MVLNQAVAQEKKEGKLYGKVVDKSSDKALAEVEVTIQPVDKKAQMSETTGKEGVYVFKSIEPGTYTASVEADGYQKWELEVKVTAKGKMLKIKLKPTTPESS